MIQMERESGSIVAVAGASQSGKSTWLRKERLEQASRLLVWDPRGEYPANMPNVERIDSKEDLFEACEGSGSGRYAFVPSMKLHEDFHFWCLMAFHWGKYWPIVAVADETADVTSPNKAPDAWGQLLRKGKFYGSWIYGVTQSPTESDKTIWFNADEKVCFRVDGDHERDYMAKRFGDGATSRSLPNQPYCAVQKFAGKSEIQKIGAW